MYIACFLIYTHVYKRFIYIYISLLPPWFGDLHTYVTNQKNNNEKKVNMKQKRTTNKNTWANNYIERRVSKIRIERKDEEKSDTFVHVTKWNIQEKYDNKSIPRLWKLREENKSKQQHTHMKIGKVEDSHDTWSAHGSSGCILVTLCQ